MAELRIYFLEGQKRQKPDRSHYVVSVVMVPGETWWGGTPLAPEAPSPVTHELPGHRDYALFLWQKKSQKFREVIDRLLVEARRKKAQTVTIVMPSEFHEPSWGNAIEIITDSRGIIKDSGFESVALTFRRECAMSLAFLQE